MIIHQQRRRGFTLVEMLVVILILAVLASLVGAGIMGWIDAQRRSATESTIVTVDKALRQQMKAVIDDAEKTPLDHIPASVRALAAGAGENERARVIWKKLRLRQAFPMSYAEALNPHMVSGTALLPAADLPPLARFVRALKGKTPNPATESSVCLLLALEQDRGGTSLGGDSLGNAVLDTDGDGLKEIVDAWGTPLAFYRWPTVKELTELNPAAAGSRQALFGDPLDPYGTLLNPAWYGTPTPSANRVLVEQLTHTIMIPSTAPAAAFYTTPVIVSAGKNMQMGLAAGTMQTSSPGDAADNIYSFRLTLNK